MADPYIKIEERMSATEKEHFLDRCNDRFPNWRGAGVADFLGLLDDHDMFLPVVEKFIEDYGWMYPTELVTSKEFRAALYAAVVNLEFEAATEEMNAPPAMVFQVKRMMGLT